MIPFYLAGLVLVISQGEAAQAPAAPIPGTPPNVVISPAADDETPALITVTPDGW
jgi:hypothetical protein